MAGKQNSALSWLIPWRRPTLSIRVVLTWISPHQTTMAMSDSGTEGHQGQSEMTASEWRSRLCRADVPVAVFIPRDWLTDWLTDWLNEWLNGTPWSGDEHPSWTVTARETTRDVWRWRHGDAVSGPQLPHPQSINQIYLSPKNSKRIWSAGTQWL